MFYVMIMIANNDGLLKMPGYGSLTSILGFGTVVVGIFSVIFLLYTNSFLIKRRKKELGLYNILGMEKRHIARILLNESIISGLFTLILGLITGIIFSKLMFLILFYIVRFSVPIGFEVKSFPILTTIALFSFINLLTLFINVVQVYLSKPIELVLGNNTGEKEPRSRLWLTIVGVISLSSGYFIAITTETPLTAISLFFIAVLLVILGTYCLFIAGSITLLKVLRKNNLFYYNKKNFIAISSMFYRMKQNAVGLASICILSTMVLVMVSTTVSLYVGVQDILELRYPSDISIELYNPIKGEGSYLRQNLIDYMNKNGIKEEMLVSYTNFNLILNQDENIFTQRKENQSYESLNAMMNIMSYDDYSSLISEPIELNHNEVLVFSNHSKLDGSFELFGKEYIVKDTIESIKYIDSYQYMTNDMYLIVVKDQAEYDLVFNKQKEIYGDQSSHEFYHIAMNLEGDKESKLNHFESISSYLNNLSYEFKNELGQTQLRDSSNRDIYVESQQANESAFYSMYGGFLFLGLFLGLLFLCATVLIIYYKQISEGYDDKERYSILKKVGMSYDEIKTSIKSQVLIIFFLPLSFAIIHIAFAFKMITKLLLLFNLTNVSLFLLCTVITLGIFSIIYGIVYGLTARVYYRIVS
jgi:putative ABC transport system permease protein